MKINFTNFFKALAVLEGFVIVGLAVSTGIYAQKYSETVPANADAGIDVRIRPYIDKEEAFYQLNGKKILTYNTVLGETFIPVFADVPQNTILPEEIVHDGKGFARYTGTEYTAKTGIDVSEFQGEIDWESVKAEGIDFAMIRAAYRTYGDGILRVDECFAENIEGAEAAGLDVGVYLYSQAVSTDEAIEEADFILDLIAGHKIRYPVVFDWEIVSEDFARTDTVGVELLADCCVSFCERVKSAGYTPMIYQNTTTSKLKLDLPRVKDYDFWLADFSAFPDYYYKYDMWQYASDGSVYGIEGSVDLDICFKDYTAEE